MPAKKEETKKKSATQAILESDEEKTSRVLKSKKAGLIFPVGRVLRIMKQRRYADRISPNCAVSICAVLEYLTTEILDIAGERTLSTESDVASKKMIKPRHICLAVKGDFEMIKAIGPDVIIPMGGVIPHIEDAIKQRKRNKRPRSSAVEKMKDAEAEDDEDDSEAGEENESVEDESIEDDEDEE
ncbi:hypothetical protein SteCoe_26943 [Stentor coeruleus]|uniref:Histone H2A n=1 Tax=Stentor coeruleus TaxID=5963 RepID=A0A1R2BBN9_9CILI|nr:hypothetical protein SteCoe_26943 [Stentor coeruleus]